jgi:glycosyltransferase involved in cell wall biosynthesis
MSDQNSAVHLTPERPELSVVIPVYNSEQTVVELCRRLRESLDRLAVTYEVLFVDDGSRDKVGEVLSQEAASHPPFRFIKLIRNFGQHPAITAGIALSRGNWIVLMDDDLQNPPEEIAKLYAKAKEGYDDVHGIRETRADGKSRRWVSGLAHLLMRILFGRQTPDAISAFRIISRRLADEYLRIREHHSYVAAIVAWLGFPQASIVVRHERRKAGRSGYTYVKLLRIWFDIAFGFSERPLTIATWIGAMLSCAAFALTIRAVILYFTSSTPLLGYTSLFAMQAMFCGVMLVFLGVLGEYVGRIYREVKNRPYFILDRQNSRPQLGPIEGQSR